MLNFLKTKTAKIGGLVVAFAMIATSSASALTQAEATAIITALNLTGSQAAVIQALVSGGSTTSGSYDFGTATMKVGSTGTYVMNLQKFLNVSADGKFGPMTKAAVMSWQASNGLTADGVFGPASRAKATSMGGTTGGTTGSTTSDTTLSGGYGTISTITQLSQYNNEEIGAGQSNVKVAGMKVKASKDGDINLNAIKLTFDSTGNSSGDSDRLADYIDTVSVWAGSTKVGSASASDFGKVSTGIYSKVINLSGAVVKSDKELDLFISVDAISNLDSGDINSDSWTVGIDNVRYVDGSGVTTTDVTSIPAAMDYDTAGDGVAMAFVSFSSASDTELEINLSSDTPAIQVAIVSTTGQKNNVELLKGTFKVEGSSDVWIDEIPFLFTTNATDVDQVAPTVTLTIDGKEFSESVGSAVGTTEVVTFDDLDLTLDAGKTYTFTVSADEVNDIETTYFDEGDYLKAELDSTRRALIVAENEQGDSLTDGTEMTGVALGNIQYFYSVAPKVEVVSTSIAPNDNGSSAPTSATAKIKLKITAQGGTVYLNGDDESTAAKELITLTYDGGDATTSVASYSYTTSGTYTTTNGGADNEYYTLNQGDTMYVEVQAVVSRGAGGTATLLTGLKGTAILFGTATTDDTSRSVNSLSFSTLTDVLKSGMTSLSRTSA